MHEQAYNEGFVKACSARGIDPEQLVKMAAPKQDAHDFVLAEIARRKAQKNWFLPTRVRPEEATPAIRAKVRKEMAQG